jgi:glycosyltransferase involved in cell wall biosynthesis
VSEDTPLVTIVTPSYNQAAFLEEAIDSVLEQDYPRLEYIVVDGASNDGSVDIIRDYENRLAWWTSRPDSGQAEALNEGFARARGSLLGWVNSDDMLLPGSVSAVVAEFQRDPELLLVYGNNVLIDERSRELGPLPAREFDVIEMLRTVQNHVPQPGSLFRREALEIAPLNERGYYYFDFEFVVALGVRGRIRRVSRPLGGYRLHAVSKSLSEPRRKAEDQLRMIDAVFALPDLPGEVLAIEPEARARAALVAAAYFYRAGEHGRARHALADAVRRSPGTALRPAAPLALRTLLPPRVAARLRALRRRRPSPVPSAPS